MHWKRNNVGLSGSRAAPVEAVVGARLVIVDQQLLDHSLQAAGAEDEQVIEYLSPAGAYEPFADRVRPTGPNGQRDQDSCQLARRNLPSRRSGRINSPCLAGTTQ